jgi:hypothetical protein
MSLERQGRAIASPMTVLRRWPTCMSFATFGPRVVDDDGERVARRREAEPRVGGCVAGEGGR